MEIANQTKAPAQINSYPASVATLEIPEAEKLILGLKYKSRQIAKLSDTERLATVKGVLLRIHIITGWIVPENELMNVLVDQFEKKLIESYGNLNDDEIEYAFRSKGTVIEDWGKTMNLNLLDKVLIPYLNERFELSKIEQEAKERAIKQLPPPTLAPEQKELDDRDFVNQYFYWVKEAWEQGKPFKIYHMPPLIYPIMNRNKKIDLSNDEKSQIREDAKKMYIEYREEFNLWFPDLKLDEAGMLDKIAKRLAVLKMFQRFIKQEFEKVF